MDVIFLQLSDWVYNVSNMELFLYLHNNLNAFIVCMMGELAWSLLRIPIDNAHSLDSLYSVPEWYSIYICRGLHSAVFSVLPFLFSEIMIVPLCQYSSNRTLLIISMHSPWIASFRFSSFSPQWIYFYAKMLNISFVTAMIVRPKQNSVIKKS